VVCGLVSATAALAADVVSRGRPAKKTKIANKCGLRTNQPTHSFIKRHSTMSSFQVQSSDETCSLITHHAKWVLHHAGQLEKQLCKFPVNVDRTPQLLSEACCSQGQVATTTTASSPYTYSANAAPIIDYEWSGDMIETPSCTPPLHETASCNRGQAQPTQPTVVCVPPTHCSRFELLTNAANSVQHSPRATATDNTKLKPDFSDDGAPATDAPKRRTKTTKNRSGAGWNGCNLYKNHMKHCWMKGDQALLDVHDYVKQHLSSAGTLYTPRKHRKSMCTVGCKPSTLDLSKGEGSNLNKTGAFLVDKWKNLSEEQRQIYNKEAQLIKVINESH